MGGGVCPEGGDYLGAGLPKGVYHVTCDVCWDTHTPVNRITDRCKNITFLQLRLQAVINTSSDMQGLQRTEGTVKHYHNQF